MEGFVLAGGASRRMGRDKSTLVIGGRTLIEIAAMALSGVADPIRVVGNLAAGQTSLPIIPDEEIGGGARGAIVGLYTAAKYAGTEWIAVLACDLPFVSSELLVRMSTVIAKVGKETVAALLPEQPDGRIQPLCGFYRAAATRLGIEELLSEDNWRLQRLAERLDTHIVPFTDIADLPGSERFFMNLNSPEDHQAALRLA